MHVLLARLRYQSRRMTSARLSEQCTMIHNLGLILLQYKCLGLCCSSFAVAPLTTGLQSLLQPSVIEAVPWLLSLMVCLLLQERRAEDLHQTHCFNAQFTTQYVCSSLTLCFSLSESSSYCLCSMSLSCTTLLSSSSSCSLCFASACSLCRRRSSTWASMARW